MSIFSKINFGLSKTRNKMSGAIDDMLDSFDDFNEDLYTELEEILVMADVGVTTAVQVVEELKSRVQKEKIKKPAEVKKELQSIIADLLYGGEDMGLITIPSVLLVIGVNGAGKTTTIGKLASMYKSQGKKVILGAADTFRAAAIDQLDVWAQRAGVDIIKHKEGADPAAVVYDTIQAGIARNCDIIICDTAGRLHNKKNLMEELGKIYRVMDRELPYADREVLLVLDATTGQNAVNQAKEFAAVAEITGIVLTKLDGTARGGVVLSIKNELKIPVKFIGVGEKLDDLQPFDPAAFAKSLFEEVDNKEDANENTLEELYNSEEYRNFVPSEGDAEEGGDELKEFVGALFEGLGGEQGLADEIDVGAGQTDRNAYEDGTPDVCETPVAAPAAAEAIAEPFEEGQTESTSDELRRKADEGRNEQDAADAEQDEAADENADGTVTVSAQTPVEPEETPVEPEAAFIEPEETPVEPEAAFIESEETRIEPEGTPVEPEETPAEPEKKKRRGLFGLFNRNA